MCSFKVIINNFNFSQETLEPILHAGDYQEFELVQMKK